MDPIETAEQVAVVGTPSSNYEVTLDLLDTAIHEPLVGSMLLLTQPSAGGEELALGTVTEVTTLNQWHSQPLLRGVVKTKGHIPGMSGDSGDVRAAAIKLQACYKRTGPGGAGVPWVQAGPSLRMSPPTGTAVRRVTNEVLDELMSGEEDLHHLGHLHGTSDVRIPMSIRDFSGDRGAFHAGVFGMSGSGKALDVDTPVPTPSGWTRMGDLRDGDTVFDEDGRPTRVVKAHEVMTGRDCYRVTFSDGSAIVADGEHLWYTEDDAVRRSAGAARRLERSRKRRPLLPPEVTARLRAEAARAGEQDTVALSEVAALSGLDTRSSALTSLARAVGPLGVQTRDGRFVYSAQQYRRTRTLPVYAGRQVLLALAGMAETGRASSPVFNPSLAPRLREAAEDAAEWMTAPDVARLIGVPTRNASLREKLRATGVPTALVRVPLTVDLEARTVVRRVPAAATAYPKAALLTALADHADRLVGDQRHKRPVGRVLTTEQVRATLRTENGEANHAVPVAAPLALSDRTLPIGPYTLGAWLGDGKSSGGSITTADPEVLLHVEDEGYITTRHAQPLQHGVRGLQPQLRAAGLLLTYPRSGGSAVKRIPREYLRASERQRRALLAGLLDTDGTVAPQGTVHFDNTNRALIDDVFELVASLGYRPTVVEKRATLDGVDHGPVWRVAFTTADPVFRLERKRSLQEIRTARHNPASTSHRYVVDVQPVPSVPVRCITVDSPSRLYLAGETMIPTHNTAFSTYFLAGQMRNPDQGIIVVDPQGQFSSETGFPFSLQAWAAELGREVVVRRVSEDLRLEKDAPLFGELLAKTKLTGEITKMAPETAGLFVDELVKVLRKRTGWDTEDSATLLRELLQALSDFTVLGRIYVDETRQNRLRDAIFEVLGDADRFADVFSQFQPLHNLFSPANPGGGKRHSMWGTISHVFDKQARAGAPAPLLVLDMSTSGQVSWVSSLLAGPEQAGALEALRVLDQDSIKAAILRKACRTLKEASEAAFRLGETLNTMVVFDEAWRYAPPLHLATDEEVKALSADLAGYFRDTRKFGIGWTLISQSPRSINADCWDQMAVRIMGYGLGGADLAKVAEQMDDPEHLKLYRAFSPPDSTKPKVYPFMVTGPVSPLSFTKAPVFLAAYTDFEQFRTDNHHWISRARLALGLPVLAGVPALAGGGPVVAARPARASVAAPRRSAATRKAVERVREHAATGGIAPDAFVGLTGDGAFSGGLGSIDDDPPF
ncbi:LAGLIDADG family homing endonuclease [Kineococcus sp. SYSU DK006]|uniref:LAGLIDADG family homing endonuclease n=1 Tax=Kineococcus sp. SYSU DK006 TaxID=3383127 RepID=UPI003D7D3FE9